MILIHTDGEILCIRVPLYKIKIMFAFNELLTKFIIRFTIYTNITSDTGLAKISL